jgi:hypothetical protein
MRKTCATHRQRIIRHQKTIAPFRHQQLHLTPRMLAYDEFGWPDKYRKADLNEEQV